MCVFPQRSHSKCVCEASFYRLVQSFALVLFEWVPVPVVVVFLTVVQSNTSVKIEKLFKLNFELKYVVFTLLLKVDHVFNTSMTVFQVLPGGRLQSSEEPHDHVFHLLLHRWDTNNIFFICKNFLPTFRINTWMSLGLRRDLTSLFISESIPTILGAYCLLLYWSV